MGIRRKLTAEFKLKVVLDALKERSTLTELSTKYNVAGSQISTWKTEFLSKAELVFDTKVVVENEDALVKERLYATIGKLQCENDFLKKKLI
jgi:transposase